MNWWDGDAACRAKGRDGMIGVNDLISGWDGTVGNEYDRTELAKALDDHFGTGFWIWTNNLEKQSTPCYAYVVSHAMGHVYKENRTYDYFVVCR